MLTSHIIRVAVEAALAEDAPYGDITCETTIPADETGSAHLTARENGVMSGIDVFAAAFAAQNPAVTVTAAIKDGERFQRGQILATVKGPVRDLLTAERIALNFTQRMSGIATMTAAFVDAVNAIYGDDYDGPVTRPRRYERTRIVDTRKTTPGLRPFEKYAVVCGGGHNHRYGLSDAVMMKDNHLAALARAASTWPARSATCANRWATPRISKWKSTALTRFPPCSPAERTPSCWTISRSTTPVAAWSSSTVRPSWKPAAT